MKHEQEQVHRKECRNISDVLLTQCAGIGFLEALEMPLQIFSGKVSIYFGNIYLALKIAVEFDCLLNREEKNVFGKCVSSSPWLMALLFPSRRSLGLCEC